MYVRFYREGILGEKIAVQCRHYVNSLNQQYTIIQSLYTFEYLRQTLGDNSSQ